MNLQCQHESGIQVHVDDTTKCTSEADAVQATRATEFVPPPPIVVPYSAFEAPLQQRSLNEEHPEHDDNSGAWPELNSDDEQLLEDVIDEVRASGHDTAPAAHRAPNKSDSGVCLSNEVLATQEIDVQAMFPALSAQATMTTTTAAPPPYAYYGSLASEKSGHGRPSGRLQATASMPWPVHRSSTLPRTDPNARAEQQLDKDGDAPPGIADSAAMTSAGIASGVDINELKAQMYAQAMAVVRAEMQSRAVPYSFAATATIDDSAMPPTLEQSQMISSVGSVHTPGTQTVAAYQPPPQSVAGALPSAPLFPDPARQEHAPTQVRAMLNPAAKRAIQGENKWRRKAAAKAPPHVEAAEREVCPL